MRRTRITQSLPLPTVVKVAVKYINIGLKPFDRKLNVFISRR